jgi:putative ABC transport system permease protein
MTLAGVAGCTALLLTAFGLRDSIGSVGSLQYDKIVEYTSRAYIKEITAAEQRSGFDLLLSELSGNYIYIREESVTAGNFSVSLIVPETALKFNEYINFRSRKTGGEVPFAPGDVLITEKLARETGVSAGGKFSMTAGSGKIYTVRIAGIVENYVQHYIYMAPDVYAELFGAEPLFNSILAVSGNPDGDSLFAETLLTNDDVRAVIETAGIKANINNSTDALQIVAVVLIILACALAFIVLFNLTNINITERIRELATIKVLGFYDLELAMYIYRENGLVTAMGIILGLIGGVWLHGFVLVSAEIDLLMFPLIINLPSYIYSVALSAIFALFVNLVMNYRLVRIDMVESLKNIE